MPILNYTTEVPAQQTVSFIVGMLARKGAQSITQDYFGDGRVKAMSFVLRVGVVPVRFLLPTNTEGVAGVLKKEKPFNYSRHRGGIETYYANQRQQAGRIAWRILKDWVEAQTALIESGQAEVAQVFMPYATEASGQTMYQVWTESAQLKLGAGEC